MKKTITPFFILFFSVFTAFGQSVTLTPSNTNSVAVRRFGGVNSPYFVGFNSEGTPALPTATLANFTILSLGGYGYTGSGFTTQPTALISFHAAEDFSNTNGGTYIKFQTTSLNQTTPFERVRISHNGNVGIGNSTPNGALSFSNLHHIRKIVLSENANNSYEYFGFGTLPDELRYQVPSTTANHIFKAGTSSTNANELMRIQGNGNVGIGTNAPVYKLQVNTGTGYGIAHSDGTVTLGTYVNAAGGWIGTQSNQPFSLFANNGSVALNVGTDRRVAINGTTNTTDAVFQINTANINPYALTMYHQSNSNKWSMGVFSQGLILNANGNIVGFFDVVGGAYTPVSDRRLKKNIAPLDDVLSKVMALKPSTYQFIKNNPNGQVSTGFIAQEVEALFPAFVHTNESPELKDLKTMDYAGMSVIALKAIQEQQVLIEKLQKENATLKSENKAFESRLSNIENLIKNESKKIFENK